MYKRQVQAGAAIGGVLGAIVGDRAGGYNASQFGALAGTVAVSYTHLDVYKRQVQF